MNDSSSYKATPPRRPTLMTPLTTFFCSHSIELDPQRVPRTWAITKIRKLRIQDASGQFSHLFEVGSDPYVG